MASLPGRALALLAVAATLALSGTALAKKLAAPEVLLAVDSSGSMQYRMGAQEPPDCAAKPPQMSRYNAVRQMLEGTFNGYGCIVSNLPSHPDATNPPKQVAGASVCIPGLNYTTGGDLAVDISGAVAAPFGTKQYIWDSGGVSEGSGSGSSGGLSGAGSALVLDTEVGQVAIPYFSFDISSVPSGKGKWAGAGLTVHIDKARWAGDPAATKKEAWVYLVAIGKSSITDPGKVFTCSVNGPSPAAISAPVQIPLISDTAASSGSGGTTLGLDVTFPLTAAAVAAMQSKAVAGQTDVFLALVPATVYMNGACTDRQGQVADQFEIEIAYNGGLAGGTQASQTPSQVQVEQAQNSQLKSNLLKGAQPSASGVGSGTNSANPKFTVTVDGKVCVGEGPTTHTTATGAPALNGVLDAYFSTSKFSVIFMDNVLSTAQTQAGGWSYAQDIDSYWGTINIGAADPRKIESVSEPITGPETQAERQATYKRIKAKLAAMKPDGGTPIGRFLSDLNEYLGPGAYKDPHYATTQEDPVYGDRYAACRFRFITLLTDGGANLHAGSTDGRNEALAAAAAIWAKGVAVYVVAVGHKNPDPAKPPPVADLDFLNALAKAGGTDEAAVISTPGELIKLLRGPLGSSVVNNEVLTSAQYIKPKFPAADVGYSFQAMSRFDPAEPMHTTGVFEQRIYRCEGACKDQSSPGTARVCDVIDFATRLRERKTARTFFSQVSGVRVVLDKSNISADDMGIAKTGLAPKLVVDEGGSCVTEAGTFNLSASVERDAYRDHLLGMMRADDGTCREGYELGAVGYSQPAILEPAEKMGLRDPVAALYVGRATPVSGALSDANPPGSRFRPTMAFAATHDGLLHAFRVDRDPNVDSKIQGGLKAGDELWAWLPGFNLKRARELKLVSEAARSYLGGSVVARHTLLDRTADTLANQAMRWRAVVVVGAGEAGAGYTAIDVSIPQRPQLLWEITPDRHCFNTGAVGNISGPNCIASTTFAGMGRSTAKPVLGSVFVVRDGKATELAVAILPAGRPPTASSVENVGVDGTGTREIYVVALENGDLIRKFEIGDLDMTGITAGVSNKSKQLGYFWSEPACFNTAPGQLVTRCFIGDSKGMIWRMDLSASDPDQWKIQWFHDAYSGQDTPSSYVLGINDPNRVPVLEPPSVARATDGRITVVYGTGGPKDEASVKRRHLVYSVAEKFAFGGGGAATRAEGVRIWVKDLGDGGRFVGPAVIFDSNAYWSSYTVSANKYCQVGMAAIWGGRFDRPRTKSDPENMLGAFPNPADPANVTKNLQKFSMGELEPSPVDIQPVPSCAGTCPPTDPTCLISAGGGLSADPQRYEVVVGNSGSSPGGTAQTPKKGPQPAVGARVKRLRAPRRTAVVTGWDLLLD